MNNMRNIPLPNEMQLNYHYDELAAFMHFGMNTFTDSEWGDGTEDPKFFNPSGFNADGIVRALKEAGFKRLIVTAKHHDGFCIWRSKYTDHSVASSPYQGDILAELSAACSLHGMDMGCYLSPWDVHEPSYGYGEGMDEETDTNGDYNEYYINQILEITSNPVYGRDGKFVEWWLDGAKGVGANAQWYNFPEWIRAMRKHNPDILIFGAGSEGGVHWVGNESGRAPDQNWCLLPDTGEFGTGEKHVAGEDSTFVWSIPEVDVSINAGWFWHEGQEPKSPQKLAEIYFNSVGRGSPLLLNVPPNTSGDFPESYYEAIRRFGENIRNSFAHNVADEFALETVSYDEAGGYTLMKLDFQTVVEFDCFELKEAIAETGQRIDRVSVRWIDENGEAHVFAEAGTVGARRLMRGPRGRTAEVQISVHTIYGEPKIDSVGAYILTDDFRLGEEDQKGELRFASETYEVKAGDTVEIGLLRDNGESRLTYFLDTPPGTAVQGQYYHDRTHESMCFEAGEKEHRHQIVTIAAGAGEEKDFYVEASYSGADGKLFVAQSRIVIKP